MKNTFFLVHCDRMQSRIDLTWFISGNDHVNLCANYESDWSTFVSDLDEELFLGHENTYCRWSSLWWYDRVLLTDCATSLPLKE